MKQYSSLLKSVENAGHNLFWLGGASDEQITLLEERLSVNLPESFKEFLRYFGGGGVEDSEISGIEDNDASLDYGGTVLGDTLAAREDYDLPEGLAVIFYEDEEICWCIDLRDQSNAEIVSYDVFSKRIASKVSENFEAFFQEYLELRSV